MQVRDENRHVDAGPQEVSELSHRREVADVHLAGRRVADVRRRVALLEQRPQFVLGDDHCGLSVTRSSRSAESIRMCDRSGDYNVPVRCDGLSRS